jgi:hypothetical protein
LDSHLQWLLYLMADHPEAWKHHCWARAKDLASADPSLVELPQMLTAAMSKPAKATDTTTTGSA